ncbi:hypothetical protein GFS31_07160 [Leptolyngbya sp. BL0902]|uniref:DUF3611 family protein n=1 Tax=Leptolyngbya sp. BL0902 TaxID=1115757 RepID=UPI0018E7DB08|nr:DUF3611 family protein [Leptolyngbya sp. BL0902]QQE64044.1 hypothetical protein GFS31_07160 [Leptolyngbya sp. BL0902]
MSFLNLKSTNPSPEDIARWCRWLGWTGLVMQAMLGFIPLLVVVTRIFTGQQIGRFGWGLWLAMACLLLLLFSIYWCFRYTRIAARLVLAERRPSKPAVKRAIKLGLLSNLAIVTLATVIALWQVSAMTLRLLSVPQGATVIAPNAAVPAAAALITPSNMITIYAMISTIAAGLVGLIVALLLIYLIGRHRVSQDSF